MLKKPRSEKTPRTWTVTRVKVASDAVVRCLLALGIIAGSDEFSEEALGAHGSKSKMRQAPTKATGKGSRRHGRRWRNPRALLLAPSMDYSLSLPTPRRHREVVLKKRDHSDVFRQTA